MSRLAYNVVIFKIEDLFKKQNISCSSNCHSVTHNVCFVFRPALINTVNDLVSHSTSRCFLRRCVLCSHSAKVFLEQQSLHKFAYFSTLDSGPTSFLIGLGNFKTCFKVPLYWLEFNYNTHFEELHFKRVHRLFIAIRAHQASYTAVAPQLQ